MLWFNPDIGRPGDHTPWKDGKGSVFEGGACPEFANGLRA
jgi:hypothetical protein